MFDFDIWFSGFWSLYDADMCGGVEKKGSRDEAIDIAEKLVNDEELGKKIFAALSAQKEYIRDCINHRQDYKKLPAASTWLRKKQWGYDIASHTEMHEKSKRSGASCKCGKPGVISQFEKTKDNDCRSDRYIGSVCLSCHNKAFEKHDWRYHACREKYKEMMDLSKDGGKSLTEQREIAKKFIDRIRSKLNAR